jgi:small GTP-binding protein
LFLSLDKAGRDETSMTYLLDTHTLIWFLRSPASLPTGIRKLIEDPASTLAVSPTFTTDCIADRLCPAEAGAAALPLVAIVGRPNVGKSTLFNRLTRSRRSIVGDEPGITRDRIYGEYEWAGRQFRVVDTGGIVPDDPELIPTEIYNQAKVALEEADALVLVVDARTELASPDYDLVKLLIRGGKPVFLAVNKVEGEAMAPAAENFRQLGNAQRVSDQLGAWAGHRRPAGCDFGGDSGAGGGIGRSDGVRTFTRLLRGEAELDELAEGLLGPEPSPERRAQMSKADAKHNGRTASLSSTRLRWPLSGGRMWASRRC